MNSKNSFLILGAAGLLLLSACGGGSGHTSTPPATSEPTAPKQVTSAWKGVKQFGVPGSSLEPRAAVADAQGNVYVTGDAYGGLNGNAQTGTMDAFVSKYGPDGNLLFTRQLGVAGKPTSGEEVATDTAGNVYMAGYTSGGLEGNPQTGSSDAFLAKFDSLGNKLFVAQYGAKAVNTFLTALALDPEGHVYATGGTSGDLSGTSATGTCDAYLLQIDGVKGKVIHAWQFGAAGKDTYGVGLVVTREGQAFISGSTKGSLDGNPMTGSVDAFLTQIDLRASYNPKGNRVFTRQFGSPGREIYGHCLALGPDGSLFMSGDAWGDLDGQKNQGGRAAFLAKFNQAGARFYLRLLTGNGWVWPGNNLCVGSDGSVFMPCSTSASLGAQLAGHWDFVLAKFDGQDGSLAFVRQMGVATPDKPYSVHTYSMGLALDSHDNAFLLAWTGGGLAGNKRIGDWDGAIAKYDSKGVLQ